MKKITALFLVLLFVFSFVGCSSTASEETVTTVIAENTVSYETVEILQWTMANVMSKNSASRLVKSSLYDEVKAEIEKYVDALPFPVEVNIEKPSIAEDFFEISIVF